MGFRKKSGRHNKLRDMLDEVETLSSSDQAKRLLAITSKIKVDAEQPAKYLATADVIRKTTTRLAHAIPDEFGDLHLPLPPEQQLSVTTYLKVLAELEQIYRDIFQCLTKTDREKKSEDLALLGRSLLGRATCTHEVIFLCASLYLNWPNSVWTSLHQTFKHGVLLKLADFRANPDDENELSLEESYGLSLLLGLIEPFKMPVKAIDQAFNYVLANRHLFTAGEYQRTTLDRNLFLIKFDVDAPGASLHNVDIRQMKGRQFVLDITDLMKNMELKLDDAADAYVQPDVEEPMPPSRERDELFTHLVETLGGRPARKAQRAADDTAYEALVGLESIFVHVSPEMDDNSGEKMTHPELIRPPVEAQGIDMSSTGLKLSVRAKDSEFVRIGEAIALRRTNTNEKHILGLIRWTRVVRTGILEIGVELLRGEAHAGVLSVPGAEREEAAAIKCVAVHDPENPTSVCSVLARGDFNVLKRLRQVWFEEESIVLESPQKLNCFSSTTCMAANVEWSSAEAKTG